jgi:hypothetical protein
MAWIVVVPPAPPPPRWEPGGDDAGACRVCRWPVEPVCSEQRIRAAIAAGRGRPVRAWQHHLGAIFGGEALGQVRASPRPRWPCPTTRGGRWVGQDRQDCGDQWLLVQQHTWSSPEGRSRELAPLPHRLAVVRPQGSNTKLVGRLHPHQAKGRNRWLLAEREEAAAGHKIADGQNPGG